MPDTTTPPAARALVKKLVGWRVSTEPSRGALPFGRRELVNGKGRLISRVENVDGYSVRAQHSDGRAFFAVWLRREDTASWTFDDGWRIWHGAERVGLYVQLTARQVSAYAVAADGPSAVAAARMAAPKVVQLKEAS